MPQSLSALSPFRRQQHLEQQEYTRLPSSTGSRISNSSSMSETAYSSTSSLLPPFESPSRRSSAASTASSTTSSGGSAGYSYSYGGTGASYSHSPTTSSRRTAVTFVLAFGLGALLVYCIIPPTSADLHLEDRLAGLTAPLSRLGFHPYATQADSDAYPQSTSVPFSSSSSSSSSLSHGPTSAAKGPCNPFRSPGQLEHVVGEVDQNLYRPWDPTCAPSTLLTSLRNGEELPWLKNRTVAIMGDSIDRDHIEYFCELARGRMEWIWEGTKHDPGYSYSPGDPVAYKSSENEQKGESGGAAQSRPRICHVEAYDLTLVFAFHYGLGDGTDRERKFPHFYPPFRFQDRLSHVLVPILRQLERYPPDLVEFGTGAWDLQHWTLEDREVDADRMLAFSKERSDWYRKRFSSALQAIEDTFPASERAAAAVNDIASPHAEEQGKDGTTTARGAVEEAGGANAAVFPDAALSVALSKRARTGEKAQKETALFFREMQHTKLTDSVPPARVHGLRRLQELLLEMEHRETGGKWQLNNIGQLLLGMEHHYRDAVHPNMYPAGKLWGDMMLYNLKQHVESSEAYKLSRRKHRQL